MTTAFIEAKQLKLAIQRIPEQSEITLTVLIKCRTIAYYKENPIAASSMEALDTFVKLIKPILNQVDAQLTYQSKHCLNISGWATLPYSLMSLLVQMTLKDVVKIGLQLAVLWIHKNVTDRRMDRKTNGQLPNLYKDA